MKMKFVIAACLFLAVLMLSGCDADFMYSRFEFVQFPYRIVYIANVDTELDLSGATLIIVDRNEDYGEEFPIIPGRRLVIEHAIDFTTPGVYQVDIVRPDWPYIRLSFFVQVIDEEVFSQLKEGVSEDANAP